MRRKVSRICCVGVAVCPILGLVMSFARYSRMVVQPSCIGAQGPIQKSLESTLNLLEEISQEPWMAPGVIPYQKRADRLDHYNEIWGYRMIRAVDTSGGVYHADSEKAVSNLNSREYIQTLWLANEPQITDAFLAGADGTALSYTVAMTVAGNAQENDATFAAIDDMEIREILGAQPMHTILLGKKQQCMSGDEGPLIGVTLETMLASARLVGGSLENTLLQVGNEESGTFWCLDGWMPAYYTFRNVGMGSGWTILTSVSFTDVAGALLPAAIVTVVGLVLAVAAFGLLPEKKEQVS